VIAAAPARLRPSPYSAAGHLLVASQVIAAARLFTVDRRRRRSWLPRRLSSLSLFSRCLRLRRRLTCTASGLRRRLLHRHRPQIRSSPPWRLLSSSSIAGCSRPFGATPLTLCMRCRLPSVRRRLHLRRPPSSCRTPSSLAGVVVAGGAAPNRSRAVQLLAPDLIVAGVLYSTSTAAATAVFFVSRSGRRH
jgi:hypothetical protein